MFLFGLSTALCQSHVVFPRLPLKSTLQRDNAQIRHAAVCHPPPTPQLSLLLPDWCLAGTQENKIDIMGHAASPLCSNRHPDTSTRFIPSHVCGSVVLFQTSQSICWLSFFEQLLHFQIQFHLVKFYHCFPSRRPFSLPWIKTVHFICGKGFSEFLKKLIQPSKVFIIHILKLIKVSGLKYFT